LLLRHLVGIIDVVPCHVKEDRLHRDGGKLRGEFDDVRQINATNGVLMQTSYKRLLHGIRGAQLVVLAEGVGVNNSSVTLKLAVEKSLEILGIFGGHGQIEGSAV
jgi:hypothetical protein